MIRLIHQEAKARVEATLRDAGETGAPMAELAVAFDRIGRCIRRSVLLVEKLTGSAPVADSARPRLAARQRIIRTVEDVIQREADDGEAPFLHAEFLDRLDSPDLEDQIGDRPVGEIIADICRDLGLGRMPGTHPWARRTPEDLVVLQARAAAAPRPRERAAEGPVAGGAPAQNGTGLLEHVTRCRDP